ncbi:hypothetical protein Tco_0117915 [Tanacetum coccineum]
MILPLYMYPVLCVEFDLLPWCRMGIRDKDSCYCGWLGIEVDNALRRIKLWGAVGRGRHLWETSSDTTLPLEILSPVSIDRPPPEGPPLYRTSSYRIPHFRRYYRRALADTELWLNCSKHPPRGYEDSTLFLNCGKQFRAEAWLINLVQTNSSSDHDKEDPHAHIRYSSTRSPPTMRDPQCSNLLR